MMISNMDCYDNNSVPIVHVPDVPPSSPSPGLPPHVLPMPEKKRGAYKCGVCKRFKATECECIAVKKQRTKSSSSSSSIDPSVSTTSSSSTSASLMPTESSSSSSSSIPSALAVNDDMDVSFDENMQSEEESDDLEAKDDDDDASESQDEVIEEKQPSAAVPHAKKRKKHKAAKELKYDSEDEDNDDNDEEEKFEWEKVSLDEPTFARRSSRSSTPQALQPLDNIPAFKGHQGSKNTGSAKSILDFFLLLFSMDVFSTFVQATNTYAKRQAVDWVDVTIGELFFFFLRLL
jgi:hypothetical protein